jgi:hypothetical protein
MDEFRLDAVVMPTNGPPFGIDLVNGDGQVMGALRRRRPQGTRR